MKKSFISRQRIPFGEEVRGGNIRKGILQCIQQDFPEFSKRDYISFAELNKYRRLYITALITDEKSILEQIDKDTLDVFQPNISFTDRVEEEGHTIPLTYGQRLADKIALFGGSWTFILSFLAFIIFWMFLNVWLLLNKGFDPYPFILLNLILSCLAAIQAPIIMMSQNRQAQKDRQHAENDYQINLKAELEIKLMSEKLNHLIVNQNKKFLEIQQLQTDYLDDLMKELRKFNEKKPEE